MNIASWLERAAAAHGSRPALFLGTDCVADYSSFAQSAAAFAGWLAAQGVTEGQRVALFAKNCPEYLIAMWGIWWAGAVAVPINAKLHAKEAAWIVENAGAVLTVVSSEMAEDYAAQSAVRVVEIGKPAWQFAVNSLALPRAHRTPDDLAWLFYTSGTTGRPKGVQITHRMLSTMSLSYFADVDEVTAEDAALYAAPLSHGAGIYCLMHVLKAARHVCPPSGGFDEAEILDLGAALGRVHIFAAPTMVKRLTTFAKSQGARGDGLRTVVYAGGPMYLADILEAVAWFGPIFVQIYGQGECPMGITALSRTDVTDRSHPRWRERLASVGRAQSGIEVRIGDEQGKPLPHGSVGEIMVRGDVVMPGYWQNEKASAETLKDGWLWTGDMGFMDAEGYVTMQDRSKDLIISGGTNIYPREVEEALMEHPSVHEAAVVGAPDAEWGEVVVAFIVPAAGAVIDSDTLDAHCLERIARFKRPKRYELLAALPKNNYGKVLKTDLRAALIK